MANPAYPVKVLEAGQGAILDFTLDDMETLDAEAGDEGWFRDALAALDRGDIKAIRRLAVVGIKGGDPDAALRALPVMDLAQLILDAMMLKMYGRTADEQEAFQLEQARKKRARLLEAARLDQMEVAK